MDAEAKALVMAAVATPLLSLTKKKASSAAVSACGWLEIVKSQAPETPGELLVPPPQLINNAGNASTAETLIARGQTEFQDNITGFFFKA